MNPITMLKNDHQKVDRLFQEHERAGSDRKRAIFDRINEELTVHAELEEQVFYPAVREASKKGQETVKEGYEEHAEVKALLAELSAMDSGDEEYERKIAELRSGVEHHVVEEEGEMLPEAERVLGPERLEQVGARMQQLRTSLLSGGRARPASGGRGAGGARPESGSGKGAAMRGRGGMSEPDEIEGGEMEGEGTRGAAGGGRGRAGAAPRTGGGRKTAGARGRSASAGRARTASASRSRAGSARGGARRKSTRGRAGAAGASRTGAGRGRKTAGRGGARGSARGGMRSTGARGAASRGRKTAGRGRKTAGRGRAAGGRGGSRSRARGSRR